MIRLAVLPFGKSGIVSASMLALGRALGETMAVLMILSPGLNYSIKLLQARRTRPSPRILPHSTLKPTIWASPR